MKNLNVKSTSIKEIEENWNLKLPATFYKKELFVRCNAKGEVNWDKAPVYRKEELETRGNYTILEIINVDEIIANEGPMPEQPMKAIGYIKTQCNEFRGIETVLVPHDYTIIGIIYKRENNQCWCTCKGDNIMDVSVEAVEIAKTVLEMSVRRKIDYTTALELYFDVKEETDAIERRDLSNFERSLLIKLKSIDENLVYHFDKVNDLIKSDLPKSELGEKLEFVIGGEFADILITWFKIQEYNYL